MNETKGIFYNLPPKCKFSCVFGAKIKPIISEDKDKYLALASNENLKKFLPDLNLEKNIDILAFAGDSFIANRLNSNDDGVGTKEALEISELFPYKFVDFNHDRTKVVGTILTASFSEFGTNKPLTKEEVKDFKKPFAVTIGGVIWRLVNESLADLIEDSQDVDSKDVAPCISWELAFSDYDLILMPANAKNFEDGKIISDASEKLKLQNRLKCYGGNGLTEDSMRIGRIPISDVIPVGVGLTDTPAATVAPIVTSDNKDNETEEAKAVILPPELEEFDRDFKNSTSKLKELISAEVIKTIKNQNILSNSEKTCVKDVTNKFMLKNIKDITDENLKECKATDIEAILNSEIKKISDDYFAKKKEAETLLSDATKKSAEVETKLKEVEAASVETSKKLSEIESKYNTLLNLNIAKEQEEKFSGRMESLDETYNLSKEDREILAGDIKEMNDEQYKSYAKKLEVLLKAKLKSAEATETALASEKNAETVVDEAINKGTKTNVELPNSTTVTETLAEKYAKTFSANGWECTAKDRKNRK